MQHRGIFTSGHENSILCVDCDAVSGFIATGGENGELCLWSTAGKLVQKTVVDADCDCTSVCFTRKQPGTLFAANGPRILVFNCCNLEKPEHSFTCNSDEVNQITLDPSERYLAACDDKGEVRIIDVKKKKLYKTLKNKHSNICSSVCFHPAYATDLFSGGMDQKLIHWVFPQHRAQASYNMTDVLAKQQDPSGYLVNPPLVYHLDVSPEGQRLACGLQSGHVAVFDSSQRDLHFLCVLKGHREGVAQVRFVTETLLVTGGNDAVIRLWDLCSSCQGGEEEGVKASSDARKKHERMVKDVSVSEARASVKGGNDATALQSGNDAVGPESVQNESYAKSFHNESTRKCGSASGTAEERSMVEAGGEKKALNEVVGGPAMKSDASQMQGKSGWKQEFVAALKSDYSAEPSPTCLLFSFQHSSKINWLVPFRDNGEVCLAVADQSSDLTVLTLPVH